MDWDFADADTHYATHGLHPYPSMMIPQIASRLLELYSERGDVVLDPFCGSGGVLVECVLSERQCIGVDINPLACLLARVKSTPLNPWTLVEVWSKMKHRIATKSSRRYARTIDLSDLNMEYWFKPRTISELAIIKSQIDQLDNLRIKDFFSLCFSSTVRAVSGTRKGEFKLYRIPSKEWSKFVPRTFDVFNDKVARAISKMGEFWNLTRNKRKIRPGVFEGDIRELFKDGSRSTPELTESSADIIVTSPPYGDSRTTVAYGQFSRYPLLWLGYSRERALSLDKSGLGGRKRQVSLDSDTLNTTLSKIRNLSRKIEVNSYFVDMNECLEKLAATLKTDGHACFVLGNRTVTGNKIPTNLILIELCGNFGLKHVTTVRRRIPSKRMPWKSSPSNLPGEGIVETISQENIVVLRKAANP